MKKAVIMSVIFVACYFFNTSAQPWYGQKGYTTDSCILSSAKLLWSNVGYVLGSVRPVRQVGSASPDFVIDQIDVAGNSLSGFRAEFQITDDPASCTGGNVIPWYNCQGVSVIETANQGQNEAYAFVGTYSRGIFFGTLDPTGALINQASWNFSYHAYNQRPSIRESFANPGTYYISGGGAGISYVMKVDAVGAQLWGRTFPNITTEARDLIESPYNSNELVVVGRTDNMNNNPTAADAFFLKLNSNNGNYING